MPTLFDPVRVGAFEAKNRVFMAPLTRARATADHVPTGIMVDYYRQRAGAGLIISEATGISLQGLGWPYAPGIWSPQQVAAWQPVTEAVHAAGGKIVCQLWHMGRVVHPSLPGRAQPVSASATTAPGLAHTYGDKQPHVEARPLRTDEIPSLLDDYAQAARNALQAGFDGIQIHAANGYLIDQFLRDNTNLRTDDYGGSIENRLRLMTLITKSVITEIGADRTGVRLSPNGERQGVNDSHPEALFEAAAAALSDLDIAFLEIREPDFHGTNGVADRPPIGPAMRKAFKNTFVVNADYDAIKGQKALDTGLADAVAYGRPFIANPDLPRRFEKQFPIEAADPGTFYTQGIKGYSDYAAYP